MSTATTGRRSSGPKKLRQDETAPPPAPREILPIQTETESPQGGPTGVSLIWQGGRQDLAVAQFQDPASRDELTRQLGEVDHRVTVELFDPLDWPDPERWSVLTGVLQSHDSRSWATT